MTRDDRFVGQLEDYLDEYEGVTPLPDAVRDAIRAELPRTRQVNHPFGPMSVLRMTMAIPAPARYGLAAAMLVLATALGTAFLTGGRNEPGDADASATPTPSPRPVSDFGSGSALPPGTYFIRGPSVMGSITVPEGWQAIENWGVVGDDPESGMLFGIWPVDAEVASVYADPCRWSGNVVDPPVGPTVDDLADALAAQPQRGDSLPTDVTIDGYRGKSVELTVPADIDFTECDSGEFRSWNGRFHQGPSQVDRVYILDVNGRRVVVTAAYMPSVPAAKRSELDAILESLDILP